MPGKKQDLARTVMAMRPMLPAKDFETCRRFYIDLGFQPRTLSEGLIEMRLGEYSFLLQNYYVQQWADNFVMHLCVSDLSRWWDIVLVLAVRYGVKTRAPRLEDWGLVAGVVDPSGVLWRIAEVTAPNSN